MKRKRVRKAYILANTIGTAGYLLLVTAWTLFVAVVLVLFMQSSSLTPSTVIVPDSQSVVSETTSNPQITAYIITAIAAVASFVILITLPYFIAKWSSRFLRHILKIIRIKVSKRSLFFIKCIAATLPLLGFALIALMTDPADMTIPAVHIATIIIGLLAMGCFLLQIYVARSLNLGAPDIW
ncbi:MAG TPA: hypothetical protein VFH06_04255 [Candidatus Saccharimonadales bacterium]|nr:hypothetical protein [Candidatus Saccharimonadales bacterium]